MLVEDDAFIILQVAGLILPKQKLLLTLVFLDSLLYFFLYLSCDVQLYTQILHFGDKVILEDPIERFAFRFFFLFLYHLDFLFHY